MLTTSVSFALRDNMPLDNINAALFISKKVKEIEELYIPKQNEFPSQEHKSYCLSVLYTVVGFLESSINDIYANAKDNFKDQMKGIEDKITILATYEKNKENNELNHEVWEYSKTNIIRKYQFALHLLEKCAINSDDEKLVNLISLIYIRNSFTHHFATWRKCGSETQSEYDRLKNHFEENPFYKDKGNPFFPDKLLGYGFLQWSINLSIRFVIDFYNKIGLQYFFLNRLEEKLDENGLSNSKEKEST